MNVLLAEARRTLEQVKKGLEVCLQKGIQLRGTKTSISEANLILIWKPPSDLETTVSVHQTCFFARSLSAPRVHSTSPTQWSSLQLPSTWERFPRPGKHMLTSRASNSLHGIPIARKRWRPRSAPTLQQWVYSQSGDHRKDCNSGNAQKCACFTV